MSDFNSEMKKFRQVRKQRTEGNLKSSWTEEAVDNARKRQALEKTIANREQAHNAALTRARFRQQDAQSGLARFQAEKAARLSEEKEPGYLARQWQDLTKDGLIGRYREYRDDNSWREPSEEWTEEWLEEFGFRYNTDPESAYSFAKEVNDYLNAKKLEQRRGKVEEWAMDHPVIATALSLGASPLGALSLADKGVEYAARGTLTQRSGFGLENYSSEISGAISRKLNEKGTLKENVPVIGGKGWGDLYSLGYSAAQSMVLGNTMGSLGTLATYFGQSGGSGVEEIKARGGSDGQALLYGLASGAAEAAAEKLPLDNLLGGGDALHYTLKSWVGNALKQAGMEGAEELATSFANEMADRWIMGDKSNFSMRVQELVSQGVDQEDAQRQAWKEYAEDAAFDFLGGALSGATSMAVQTGPATLIANSETRSAYTPEMDAALLEIAGQTEEGSLPYNLAQEYAKADKLSGGQLNQLAGVYEEYTDAQDAEALTEEAGERLDALDAADDTVAQAIAKTITGQELNRRERRALEHSAEGRKVLQDMQAEQEIPATPEMPDAGYPWKLGNTMLRNYEQNLRNPAADPLMEAIEAQEIAEAAMAAEEGAENAHSNPVSEADETAVGTVAENATVEPSGISEQLTQETVEAARAVEASVNNVEETASIPDDSGAEVEPEVQGRTIEEVAGEYGNQAKDVTELYREGQDVEEFASAVRAAWEMGGSGIPMERVNSSPRTQGITAEQRRTAYLLGQGAARVAAQSKDKSNAKKATGGTVRRKGVVKAQSGITIDELSRTFNDRQRSAYKLLSFYAEVTGVDVVLYKGTQEQETGRFAHGEDTIYIDITAGTNGWDTTDLSAYTMMRTFAHEFVHFVEKWSAEQYNQLREVVFAQMEKNGQNAEELVELAMQEQGLSFEMASREVVAEALTDILPDSQFVQTLASKHKTLFEKIRERLEQFVADLKDHWKKLTGNNSREAVALKSQVGEALGYAEEILQVFDRAAGEAVEAYQATVSEKEVAREEPKPKKAERPKEQTVKAEKAAEAPRQEEQAAQNEKLRSEPTPEVKHETVKPAAESEKAAERKSSAAKAKKATAERHEELRAVVREYFAKTREKLRKVSEVLRQIAGKIRSGIKAGAKDLGRLNRTLKEAADAFRGLSRSLASEARAFKDRVDSRKSEMSLFDRVWGWAEERWGVPGVTPEMLEQMERLIAKYDRMIPECDDLISRYDSYISEGYQIVARYDALISEGKRHIGKAEALISEGERLVTAYDTLISESEQLIAEQDAVIEQLTAEPPEPIEQADTEITMEDLPSWATDIMVEWTAPDGSVLKRTHDWIRPNGIANRLKNSPTLTVNELIEELWHNKEARAVFELYRDAGYGNHTASEVMRWQEINIVDQTGGSREKAWKKYPEFTANFSDGAKGLVPGQDKAATKAETAPTVKEEAQEPQTITDDRFTIEATKGGTVYVAFPGKPDAAVRDALKEQGFKWSPKKKAWYAKGDPAAVADFLQETYKAEEPVEAVPKTKETSPVAEASDTTIKEETKHDDEAEAGRILADRADGPGDSGVLGDGKAGTGAADDGGRDSVGVPAAGGREAVRHGSGADAQRSERGSDDGGSQSRVSELTDEAPAGELSEAVQEQTERSAPREPESCNWVIGDSLDLPQGDKARVRANLDAIAIVKRLEQTGQRATAAEQAQLAKYVGWGGLDGIFNDYRKEHADEREELKKLLTDQEYRAARASTTTAFYTDIGIIRAVYDGLTSLGFTGGRILEPAAGVGHFAGAMPANVRQGVKSMTMVELDSITGAIAKHLYPGMDVRVEGFETTNLPNNYMDAAVGNVPFGNFGVVDKNYPKKIAGTIHNYFFAKTLDKVRPGGIVVMLTSRYTMDSNDSTAREYISKKADLLGAIRLPDNAFKSNAGTEVVSDILIFKKRAVGTPYTGADFVTGPRYYNGTNDYFKQHPEMILGTIEQKHGRYGLGTTIKAREGDLGQQIREAFGKIEGKMDYPTAKDREHTNFAVERGARKPKSGGYAIRDGKLVRSENGQIVDHKLDEKTAKRVTGMVGIRDAARKLQNAQLQGQNPASIRKARTELNDLYDAFVKQHGFLNAPANKKAMQDDPDRYSILALENWDSDTKKATKADIFTKNTVTPNRTVTSADTVEEGLIVSRNQTGGVDTDLIARLTGRSAEEVTRELIDTRLAFKRPDGTLEAAETYLSGNVRAKLREAEGLAPMDKDFHNNAEALRPLIPRDIPYTEIFVNPGATWLPAQIYGDFAAELLGGSNNEWRQDVKVTYHPQTGSYAVTLNSAYLKQNARNTQKYGTPRKTFLEILEAVLNSKSITVWDKVGDTRVVNEQATAAANEKAELLGEELRKWLWKDESRRTELARLYNEQFNCLVNPKYDGSKLTFNGMNAAMKLRPHQLDAVQRIISSGGNTLLAHRVGAGKTFEMAAAAMKLKELGLVKKPMFAVPKSLVAQWGKEFADLFPAARLMVAEPGDFTADNRKTFANRVANGDYDAVIVSYEQFERLPISSDFATRLYQEQVDSVVDAIAEAKAEEGKRASVKDLERTRKSLENKIKALADAAKDDNIRFEELGVDALFVDEAHNFKNLFYSTSMSNVAGLGNRDGSKRAFDLYTKVRYLQQLNGGKGIVFATATPVMNSMAEMFIMQRYLQPQMLHDLGIENFDAWAKQFGEVVNGLEISPSGTGYRIKQSFSRFKNLPELQLMFRNMADVMTTVPGLKIPKMKSGKPIIVECEPGEFQKAYMEQLNNRVKQVKGKDPREDNMLKITSDGRKIAYTQRMIDPTLPYEEGCKLFRCADNVLETYRKTGEDRGVQMVFLDMATPKGKSGKETDTAEDGMDMENARLYEDLRSRLVEGGIPGKEIAFIHDADTDVKKKKLFADVNEGKVRVLIGSTGKMGVGMNAQQRAVAIHHLDAPWRPGDVEQRNGRVFRQGNRNKEVACYYYVTKGSYDARLWNKLDTKQQFVEQAMSGSDVGRDIEDTGEVVLSAAEAMAVAAGSPLIMEQVKLENEIKKLESLRRAHSQAVSDAAKGLAKNQTEAKQLEGYIEKAGKDLKQRTNAWQEKTFSVTIGKKVYTDRKDAGPAMMKAAEKAAVDTGYTTIGSFAGFDLRVVKTAEGIQAMLSGAQGYTFKTYPNNLPYMVKAMCETAGGIDTAKQRWEKRLERTREDIAEQEKLLDKPFDKEQRLQEARVRYREVMAELTPKEEQRLDKLDGEADQKQVRRYRAPSDAEYAKAVSAGDMETAQKMVDAAARSAGYTVKGYHGTENPGFTTFRGTLWATRSKEVAKTYGPYFGVRNRSETAPYDSDGVYAVCYKLGNNLRIDAMRDPWDALPIRESDYPGLYVDEDTGEITTDAVAAWAKENGYDSVTFENVDDGGITTVDVVFDPSRDAKSADPVTYGDDGAVIPLSERFGAESDDIRYQMRRVALTDRQVLEMAAGRIDESKLTPAEQDGFRIFSERLERLRTLQEDRSELGHLYKEQQFGPGGDRKAAAETLEKMHRLDASIEAAADKVLEAEKGAALRKVLQEARKVVQKDQKAHDEAVLKEYRQRRNESAAQRKYRKAIQREVSTLREWLVHPDNKSAVKHIPDVLKGPVSSFIAAIDLTSKNGGTKADERLAKKMQAVLDAYKRHIDDVGGLYSGYADLPPDFVDRLTEMVNKTWQIAKSGGESHRVNGGEMSAADLQKLYHLVREMKRHITTVNKFHANAMFQFASDAAQDTMKHLGKMGKYQNTALDGADQFVFWKNVRPAYIFERFGKGGMAIYDGLRRGQGQLARNTQTIKKFSDRAYKAEEVNAWEKEIKRVRLPSGGSIRLTVAQMMSLYCLSKREQALSHLLGGGIRGANIQGTDTEAQHLTMEDIQAIRDRLTKRQRAVADKLQRFMSEQGGEWGNAVTVKRFGERQFTEEFYFPINTDGQLRNAEADKPDGSDLYALLNMSFTKKLTPNANNRVMLYSVFDVFANHMASMAQYNAMALPVLDALKWFNYRDTWKTVDGKPAQDSVREQMARAFGAPVSKEGVKDGRGYAETFVLNILRSYNGTEAQGTPNDGMGLKMLHRYNRAQVAWNASVVLKQPLAILRAAQEISYSSIAKGLAVTPAQRKQDIKEMGEHSGIAAWKGLGFYDVNISRGLTKLIKHNDTALDKYVELGMKGAEIADQQTWAAMWNACKQEVVRKGIRPGSSQFFEKTTELFEDVIYKTQVVDSILTKTEYMRDKGFFSRLTSSFMSEPVTAVSPFLETAYRIKADVNRKGGSFQSAWQKHSGKLGRYAYVYGVTAVITAALQSVIDAWRDDDDYKTFWEKMMATLAGNIGEELDPFEKLPVIKEIGTILSAVIEKARGGDGWLQLSTLPMGDVAEYTVDATEILMKKLKGQSTGYTWYGAVRKYLQAASGAFGIPLATPTREAVDLWNNFVGRMAPSLKVKTYEAKPADELRDAFLGGFVDEETATARLLELGKAEDENEAYWKLRSWEGGADWNKYDALAQAMAKGGDISGEMDELTTHGVKEKTVRSQIRTIVGEWLAEGVITEAEARSLLMKYGERDGEEADEAVMKWKCEIDTGIPFNGIKEAYLDGEITAAQAKQMYAKYGGYDQEKAAAAVEKWRSEKETGTAYDNIADAVLDGEITEKQAAQMYQDYGGYEAAEAQEMAHRLAFIRDNPSCQDISSAAVADYEDHCKGVGISAKTFYDAWKRFNDTRSIKDESGKTTTSKREQVMEQIDAMNLTAAQKDALYFAFGYAESKLWDTPWH